jgi:hypothetical protein
MFEGHAFITPNRAATIGAAAAMETAETAITRANTTGRPAGHSRMLSWTPRRDQTSSSLDSINESLTVLLLCMRFFVSCVIAAARQMVGMWGWLVGLFSLHLSSLVRTFPV